jgi:predicted ATPase
MALYHPALTLLERLPSGDERDRREMAGWQQAKSWEMRATMSLARLWQAQGRGKEARQMLAEIYGWFTEGFDTPDLLAAKVLLDELGARRETRDVSSERNGSA